MKNQLNIRISDLTRKQVNELMQALNDTQTSIIATAVDRMHKEEIPMFQRQNQTLEINDLVGVNPGSNTHGCQDYAVLRYVGDGKGKVIEASSCHSCWQVGHDNDHVFAEIGEVWDISPGEVSLAQENWASNVKWEM